MDDVIERFSEPEEVVHDYISEALEQKIYAKKFSLGALSKDFAHTAYWPLVALAVRTIALSLYCQRK